MSTEQLSLYVLQKSNNYLLDFTFELEDLLMMNAHIHYLFVKMNYRQNIQAMLTMILY
jgi:hypothetical protein